MMGEACLEMEDEAPDEAENDRRVAVDNTRGVDGEQLRLQEDGERKSKQESRSRQRIDLRTLTCLSARKVRTFEMFSSLKIRCGGDLNLYILKARLFIHLFIAEPH